jgi:hypothetical protein
MSGKMIERVARALCDALEVGAVASCVRDGALCQRQSPPYECDSFIQARAAIAAMREPTSDMAMAVHFKFGADFDGNKGREVWQSMIDTALEE